jgi:cytoplasmic iron level regulating protein YaaA (DUF328/UPF0246 family)
MLTLISPAKIQDFKTKAPFDNHSLPQFMNEADELMQQLRGLSIQDLSKIMNISRKLSEENLDKYFRWQLPFTTENAKQAIFAYNGEVYKGLNGGTLKEKELNYLQSHLRIITGLYGILKPLDLIQPYRLEAKTKLITEEGQDLYAFWKQKVTNEVKIALKNADNPKTILNLASNEYSKMVDFNQIDAKVIDFDFQQYYHDTDKYKTIVIYLKKARGLMVRYIAENQISNFEEIKAFSSEGYWYNEELSTQSKMVFVR